MILINLFLVWYLTVHVNGVFFTPTTNLHILSLCPNGQPGTERFTVYATKTNTNKSYKIERPDRTIKDSEKDWFDPTWERVFSFYAYSENGLNRKEYFIYNHIDSGRTKIKTSEWVDSDWKLVYKFWTPKNLDANDPELRKYYFSKSDGTTESTDRYIFALGQSETKAGGWDSNAGSYFLAWRPDAVSDGIRYAIDKINTDGTLIPNTRFVIKEIHDGCDEAVGRRSLLQEMSDEPNKYFATVGYHCAADEQIALLSPLMRLVNFSLSRRYELYDYPNVLSANINEVQIASAMRDILKDRCTWTKVGLVTGSKRFERYASYLKTYFGKHAISIGLEVHAYNPVSGQDVSVWDDILEANTRIVIFLGTIKQLVLTLCDQVQNQRAGLVILTPIRPDGPNHEFWLEGIDTTLCGATEMSAAANNLILFDDLHFRTDPETVNDCFAVKASEIKTEWEAYMTAGDIKPKENAYNAMDAICSLVKNVASFKTNHRRYSLHEQNLSFNDASLHCREHGGFLAVIDKHTVDDNLAKIKVLTQNVVSTTIKYFLINAYRVDNAKYLTIDNEVINFDQIMWDPVPDNGGLGIPEKDYVAIKIAHDNTVKITDVGDAVGLHGDAKYGFLCEYGPVDDLIYRKSEESFAAFTKEMEKLEYEGMVGKIKYFTAGTPSTSVLISQPQGTGIKAVGEWKTETNSLDFTLGNLVFDTSVTDSCAFGTNDFPKCARYRVPIFNTCEWLPCDTSPGMEGIVPNCLCMGGWYNTTAAKVNGAPHECANCTEDIDPFFCPENEITFAPLPTTGLVIPDDMTGLMTFEKKAALTLVVPSNVKSISLNNHFSDAFVRAAEEVYGRNATVTVNYMTTSGRRRLMDLNDLNIDDRSLYEWTDDVSLLHHMMEGIDLDEYEGTGDENVDRRALQGVLHTVVLYELEVIKFFVDAIQEDEVIFGDNLQQSLTTEMQSDVNLQGFSVVMVEFPAPEATDSLIAGPDEDIATNSTMFWSDDEEVEEVDDFRPLEYVAIVLISLFGLCILGFCCLVVKGIVSKKEEKPEYKTQVSELQILDKKDEDDEEMVETDLDGATDDDESVAEAIEDLPQDDAKSDLGSKGEDVEKQSLASKGSKKSQRSQASKKSKGSQGSKKSES